MIELRLEVDKGREALAERFFDAGQRLLRSLDSLADTPTDWVLTELKLGSGIVAVAAPDPAQAPPLLSLVRGLATVLEGGSPDGWNPDTYSEARNLVEVAGAAEGVASLTLVPESQGGEVIDLTPHLARRLAQAQPAARVVPGSIRGEVTGVNISRGNRASVRLQTGTTVRAKFPDALRDDFREALYGFVELVGEIRQDAHGKPYHVSVTSLRNISAPAVRWSDLLGSDPGATDGLPVLEYLRRIRGE